MCHTRHDQIQLLLPRQPAEQRVAGARSKSCLSTDPSLRTSSAQRQQLPSPCKACKQQSTHLTPCLVGMFWLYGRTKQTGIKPLHYTHLRACLVGMTSEGCSGSGKRTRTCKKVDETVFQAVLKSKLSGSELNSFSPEADASHRGP